jgi:hypothetical protein
MIAMCIRPPHGSDGCSRTVRRYTLSRMALSMMSSASGMPVATKIAPGLRIFTKAAMTNPTSRPALRSVELVAASSMAAWPMSARVRPLGLVSSRAESVRRDEVPDLCGSASLPELGREVVGSLKKHWPQLLPALWRKSLFDSGEAECSGWSVIGAENGGAHSPTPFNEETRVHGVTGFTGQDDPLANLCRRMAHPVGRDQVGVGKVRIDLAVRQVGKNDETCGSDPKGETDPFVQDVGTDGETTVFAKQADSFVAAAYGEERTLPGSNRQAAHNRLGYVADVVPASGSCAQEVHLRAEKPTSDPIAIDKAFAMQRREQPMNGRPGHAGPPSNGRSRSAQWFVGRNRAQHSADPANDIDWPASLTVHSMDNTKPKGS